MKEERVTLTCLFLHDTQMADLEREQKLLRKIAANLYSRDDARAAWIPFTFTQAFCPLDAVRPGAGKLIIGEPRASGGWIIRPVAFERGIGDNTANGSISKQGRILPAIPFYPELPPDAGFILAHADPARLDRAEERARTIAEKLRESGEARAFSVNVWYEAKLTLDIAAEETRSYATLRDVGTPSWKKLTAISPKRNG